MSARSETDWHPLLVPLVFLSGAAALVYEVLWLKDLGLLFGNTAYAAGTTLAVLFAGLSAGAHVFGRRAAAVRRPLRAYAALELGVAAAALAYLVLREAPALAYPALLTLLDGRPAVVLLARIALAAVLLFPAAFLIGGTLPLLGQHLVRRPDRLGRTASLLYAVNTAGAAAGAAAAGFYLPAALGMRHSYLVAVAANVAVAAGAWALARRGTEDHTWRVSPAARAHAAAPVVLLAFLSGFGVLALEVLWTRMFALVLHNSVYSFAAVLVVLLVALAVGSVLAHALSRTAARPAAVLSLLATAAGVAVALTPFVFHRLTGGLRYLAPDADWPAYVGVIFGTAALVTFVPAALCGVVWPYLLRVSEGAYANAGAAIGRLAAANALGAIAGSLAAAFVLLALAGLWESVRIVAGLYLIAALILATGPRGAAATGPAPAAGRAVRPALALAPALAAVLGLVVLVTTLDGSRLPVVRIDHARGERLEASWEGAHGLVAVVRGKNGLRVKLDNHYVLGGSGAEAYEQAQADLPLVIGPGPRSVFFLGLGTGITAGAALGHPLQRLTAAELVPEVVLAAAHHFDPYTNGLFRDPRARVVVGDGRTHLAGTRERYDAIIADLFIPWHAGTASLYTREHFRAARARLAPEGLFAQWLPSYQLSAEELAIVARTMLDVFPQVTLWRGDFLAHRPIVALIGQEAGAHLDPARVVRNVRRSTRGALDGDRRVVALTCLRYAGNVSANRALFDDAPPNTADHPILEYRAPVTQRRVRAGKDSWLTAQRLVDLYERLLAGTPPERDPYLRALGSGERGFVRAGLTLYKALAHEGADRREEMRRMREELMEALPIEVYRLFADRLGRLE
jgi:spermidine synthase